MCKSKRILWLINHTTLCAFEVPMLRSFGYEVYLPKIFPSDEANRSASVNFTYDETLTIPPEDLAALNQHDFYNQKTSPAIRKIMNEHFSIAIIAFFPKMLEETVYHFEGKILLRAFGLAGETQYSGVIQQLLGDDFLLRLRSLGSRFWFAQAYANLAEIESHLKSRAVFLPLGLPNTHFMLENKNQRVRDINKILFVCPRINSSPAYYGTIYQTFKKQFGNLPHLIAGAQPIPVDDVNVAGFQPRNQFDEWLQTFKVMFYHSQEPRHLHYHPIEAIAAGMPLIYMKGGMLDQFGGKNQPGACHDFAEAREKIGRILGNDKKFIDEILSKQLSLLKPFTYEYVEKEWKKNFVDVVANNPYKKLKKIGIFLPLPYRGGSLNGAKNLAKMIRMGSRAQGEPVDVVFSYAANFYNVKEDFSDLLEQGITVRETRWKTFSKAETANLLAFENIKIGLNHDHYIYPTDSHIDFMDCDFWMIVSDRTSHPVAPIKPYGMLIYDYIQRYIPELLGDFFEYPFFASARYAEFVLTTTPFTQDDAIQYAGTSSKKTHLIPMEFNPFWVTPKQYPEKNYFIWSTNAARHKNHLNAIKALDIYYNVLDGKLNVIMTGVDTDYFNLDHALENPNVYIQKIRDFLEEKSTVQQRLHIKGHLSTPEYLSILSSAKFLWHPALIDNGTYSVIEAAYYETPSLSSNYPQMHYINERFNLGLNFCNATEPEDMAAQLKHMEENHEKNRQLLPKKEFLEQFSYKKIAPDVWNTIRGLI